MRDGWKSGKTLAVVILAVVYIESLISEMKRSLSW